MATFWTMASFSSKSLDMKHELQPLCCCWKAFDMTCSPHFPLKLKNPTLVFPCVIRTVFFWTCNIFFACHNQSSTEF